MLGTLFKFIVMTGTNAAMIPALNVMKKNRRHFELFIGCFHLFICFCFNATAALDMPFFLDELEWHFIADVLSVTYALMLCVHLMGIPDENTNIILRYVAFALAWLTKEKDQWDSQGFETLLIGAYVLGALYRNISPSPTKPPIDFEHAKKAALSVAVLGLTFLLHEYEILFASDSEMSLVYGIYHFSAGGFFYYAWLTVPVRDTKKYDDDIPIHFNRSTFN